jgi:hypothetical protein
MLRVGIVAEGPSDWLVLEEVMKSVHPDLEFVRLQPNRTLSPGFSQGWRGVKAWCETNGSRLELIMASASARPIHILAIHADCSMADKANAEHPCPPASDTAVALAKVIEKDWLGRDPRPAFVVIATPSQSSDAWVVATLDPPCANLTEIECDKAVEDEFVRRKLLRRRVGQVKKQEKIYAPIAARINQAIETVCTHCPQAEVFRSNFRDAVARSLPSEAP